MWRSLFNIYPHWMHSIGWSLSQCAPLVGKRDKRQAEKTLGFTANSFTKMSVTSSDNNQSIISNVNNTQIDAVQLLPSVAMSICRSKNQSILHSNGETFRTQCDMKETNIICIICWRLKGLICFVESFRSEIIMLGAKSLLLLQFLDMIWILFNFWSLKCVCGGWVSLAKLAFSRQIQYLCHIYKCI